MVLRRVSAFAEAEAMGQAALPRFPDSSWLAVVHAWSAIERHDHAEATLRWAAIRNRFPGQAEGYSIGCFALLRLGRADEAEAIVAQGIARFPDDHFMMWQHAEAATARDDVEEAGRRWTRGLAAHPGSIEIRRGAGLHATRHQWTATEPAPEPAGGMASGELFLAFSSLGCNCEFGMNQRNAGVEPLELLRWAGNSPPQLRFMLEDKLHAVGRAETTRLVVINGEYLLVVGEYFGMHTFMPAKPDDDPAETQKLAEKMIRRLGFLRDKMIADLAEGRKIFVFQQHGDGLTDEVLLELHALMQDYGDTILLGVRAPPRPELEGSVAWIADGVMVGHISGLDPVPNASPERYAAWTRLCTRALHLAGRTDSLSGP